MNRGYAEVLVEQNINGKTDTAYVYGAVAGSAADRLSLDRFDGSTGYYLYDSQGSVTGITNEEGQVYQSYRYGAFGGITFGAPQYENEYTYNGESYNPNIQSQYLRARYYNVVNGNFLTEDSYLGSIAELLTLNRYSYCAGNPVNYADSSGNMMFSHTYDIPDPGEVEGLRAAYEFIRATAEYTVENTRASLRNAVLDFAGQGELQLMLVSAPGDAWERGHQLLEGFSDAQKEIYMWDASGRQEHKLYVETYTERADLWLPYYVGRCGSYLLNETISQAEMAAGVLEMLEGGSGTAAAFVTGQVYLIPGTVSVTEAGMGIAGAGMSGHARIHVQTQTDAHEISQLLGRIWMMSGGTGHGGAGTDKTEDSSASEGGSGGRLIPGTEGVVTGGDSTKLGKNMMESMGLPRGTNWTGHQAQHIIPAEMANHPVLQRIGMDLDDASNGLFLRTPADDISAMSRHRGYHSTYNEFVRIQLDGIDINQSVDVLQKQVYDLQQNLKYLQQSGLPLYPSQGATVDLWQRSLERIQ